MEPVLSSPSPVSPLVDLLPLSLGPGTLSLPVTEGTETVLDNRETSQYTHTLTGRRLGGLYNCTVANNKPSNTSVDLHVEGTQ